MKELRLKRIYLEITDACNLDCPFCTNEKGHSFMSLDDISSYLKQIREYCQYIYLHVLGEPLLHPDIEKIFFLCDELDLKVNLVTNGTLLYPDLIKHPSLRKISISLHSISNLNIQKKYFENIDKLINNHQNKIVELRFYDENHLSQDLKDFLYSYIPLEHSNNYKYQDNVYFTFSDFFKWPDISDPINPTSGKCLGLIEQLAILHDGTVTSCCLDPKGHNSIGNLHQNSLKEILNSQLYSDNLELFKKQRLELSLCKHCYYHTKRFDGKHN